MLFGIDTASVAGNKNINWTKAKAEGSVSFAILRATYGDVEDTKCTEEILKAKEVGLTTGAYAFIRFPKDGKKAPGMVSQAEKLVEVFIKTLPDMPPIMDVEFPGGRAATKLSVDDIMKELQKFYDVILQGLGTHPIVYTSARVWKEDLQNTKNKLLTSAPLWLARYPFKAGVAKRNPTDFLQGKNTPPVPTPWGDADNWWIHQYQGDATDLPGFNGKVDMNRFNTLIKGAKGNRVKWLQTKLYNSGGTHLSINGQFSEEVETELKDFQSRRHLNPDGIVGPKTFAKLAWEK